LSNVSPTLLADHCTHEQGQQGDTMASIDSNKCEVFESASANDNTVWSRLIGLGLETPRRTNVTNDKRVVLLIAGATICGFALVSAVLLMTLR
jgi:hypothetical protein